MSPRFTVAAGLFLAIAASQVFVVLAFASGWSRYTAAEPVLLAVGACAAAVVCLEWSRGQSVQVDKDGITLVSQGSTINWENLGSLTYGGASIDPHTLSRAGKKRVVLNHGRRKWVLSPDEGESSAELYHRICEARMTGYSATLNGDLAERLADLTTRFSPELILAARPGTVPLGGKRVRRGIVFAIVTFFCFALAAALLSRSSGMAAGASAISGFAFLIVLMMAIVDTMRQGGEPVGDGGIIISPEGIVLSKKDLSGQMKWSELKSLDLQPNATRPTRLRLRLSGVDIILTDEFTLPLWHIYKQCGAVMNEPSVDSQSEPRKAKRGQQRNEIVDDGNPYRPPQDF